MKSISNWLGGSLICLPVTHYMGAKSPFRPCRLVKQVPCIFLIDSTMCEIVVFG